MSCAPVINSRSKNDNSCSIRENDVNVVDGRFGDSGSFRASGGATLARRILVQFVRARYGRSPASLYGSCLSLRKSNSFGSKTTRHLLIACCSQNCIHKSVCAIELVNFFFNFTNNLIQLFLINPLGVRRRENSMIRRKRKK